MTAGYGESEAQNAGMYKTDFGYSFYPPNEEEGADDDDSSTSNES